MVDKIEAAMLGLVKPYAGNKRTSRKPVTPEEMTAALQAHAVKLHDKGDGHGVDWPAVAADLFKAAFACLDQAKGDGQALKVARRVHDGAYNRLVGSPDTETPYGDKRPERPPGLPGHTPVPGLDHTP